MNAGGVVFSFFFVSLKKEGRKANRLTTSAKSGKKKFLMNFQKAL